jgi:protein-S-isoprenylcysteine O-methyltransferase Ste14
MIARMVGQSAVTFVVAALLLFVPAGTVAWPAGWIFLVEFVALSLGVGLWLAHHDPGLLAERMAGLFRREQQPWDRALMAVFVALMIVWLPVMALDAVRFGASHIPAWLQGLGALAIALSFGIMALVFRANSYTAAVVRIQAERGHRVVTAGPYRVVRHPMYAGAIPLFLGAPLLLGSWIGLTFAPVLMGLLGARAVMEERMLTAGLEGYPEYAARVRYRLIPLVW